MTSDTTSSETEHLRRQIEGTRRELSSDVNALTEKVTPSRIVGRRVDRAKGSFANLKDKIMGSTYSTTDTMSSATSSTAERVSGMASDAADTVRSAPQAVRRQTEGNPMAAGLIAFGAGWLISSLLPSTRKEQELATQVKDVAAERLQPLGEKVQQAAVEVKDNLREPAQQAVDSVKATASDATETVTDESRHAAQHVSGRASAAKDNLRDQSSSTTSSSASSPTTY